MKQLYCDCCGKPIPSLYDSVSCGPYEMCYDCARIWRSVAEQTYSVLLRETRRRVELWKTVKSVEARDDLSVQ